MLATQHFYKYDVLQMADYYHITHLLRNFEPGD